MYEIELNQFGNSFEKELTNKIIISEDILYPFQDDGNRGIITSTDLKKHLTSIGCNLSNFTGLNIDYYVHPRELGGFGAAIYAKTLTNLTYSGGDTGSLPSIYFKGRLRRLRIKLNFLYNSKTIHNYSTGGLTSYAMFFYLCSKHNYIYKDGRQSTATFDVKLLPMTPATKPEKYYFRSMILNSSVLISGYSQIVSNGLMSVSDKNGNVYPGLYEDFNKSIMVDDLDIIFYDYMDIYNSRVTTGDHMKDKPIDTTFYFGEFVKTLVPGKTVAEDPNTLETDINVFPTVYIKHLEIWYQ